MVKNISAFITNDGIIRHTSELTDCQERRAIDLPDNKVQIIKQGLNSKLAFNERTHEIMNSISHSATKISFDHSALLRENTEQYEDNSPIEGKYHKSKHSVLNQITSGKGPPIDLETKIHTWIGRLFTPLLLIIALAIAAYGIIVKYKLCACTRIRDSIRRRAAERNNMINYTVTKRSGNNNNENSQPAPPSAPNKPQFPEQAQSQTPLLAYSNLEHSLRRNETYQEQEARQPTGSTQIIDGIYDFIAKARQQHTEHVKKEYAQQDQLERLEEEDKRHRRAEQEETRFHESTTRHLTENQQQKASTFPGHNAESTELISHFNNLKQQEINSEKNTKFKF